MEPAAIRQWLWRSRSRCGLSLTELSQVTMPLRTDRPPVAVIINPAAHKGGAARRWSAIQAELISRLGPFEPRFTTAPGQATELARAALAEGVRRIVAVGGDGTVNETLNGMLDASGRLTAPDAVLCPIPAGTAKCWPWLGGLVSYIT